MSAVNVSGVVSAVASVGVAVAAVGVASLGVYAVLRSLDLLRSALSWSAPDDVEDRIAEYHAMADLAGSEDWSGRYDADGDPLSADEARAEFEAFANEHRDGLPDALGPQDDENFGSGDGMWGGAERSESSRRDEEDERGGPSMFG